MGKEKEFKTLSEKIIFGKTFGEERRYKDVIKSEDVKEFIKLLKYGCGNNETFNEVIDRLAGDKLT